MIKVEEINYQQDNYYNDDIYGFYKEDIKNYIEKYNSEDYYKIIKDDKRTNIVNIFSEMKSNIIKWYPFENTKSILEIGANYGEITGELVKKCKEVTAIEFCKEKIDCILKRLKETKNLKLILSSNLNNLKLNNKYDYIIMIGTAEYARTLGFESLKEMINWAYEKINDDGKVFVAIDNKLGAKYLAGSNRNIEEYPFANYKPHVQKKYNFYGKRELENILKNNNIENYKFYYPVPNYNFTHLIYTDEYLPKNSKYNIYYREDEEILFNELNLVEETIKNGVFDIFTNSYFIEISKKQQNISDIYYVNYSNMRKKEYSIITKILKTGVEKKANNENANNHISQINENVKKLQELGFECCEKFENGVIVSEYILKPTIDIYLKDLIDCDKKKLFYEELENWYNFILNKFSIIPNTKNTIFEKYGINISENDKKELTIIQDGFIDLVFQNVFFDGSKYIIFDQEWYEAPLPIEFLMYRSIKQLFFQHKELELKIDKNELYIKYNIEKFIDIFDKLEEKWQENIVNEEVFLFYSEKWNRIISLEDIKFRYNQEFGKIYSQRDSLQNEVTLLKQSNELKEKEIRLLQQNIIQKEKEIEEFKSSKIYKIFYRRKSDEK